MSETIAWSEDFTYDYYKKLLLTIKDNFNICSFAEIPQQLKDLNKSSKSNILVRHDIDLDLEKAYEMAKIENELGIPACYMIMTNSPFYSLNDKVSQEYLQQIQELGHEIALHYDLNDNIKTNDILDNNVQADIDNSIKMIENVIGKTVKSISFHRPIPELINGPLYVNGCVNAYAKELMGWYLSDSKGRWREGEPSLKLSEPTKPLLQFLVHPFWWRDEHVSAPDVLQIFFKNKTKGLNDVEMDRFDKDLATHLTILRNENYKENVNW